MYRILGIILCLAAAPVTAQPSPENLFNDMLQALAELNYQGTLITFKNAKLDTSKYSHASQGGKQQERLSALNSPLREVVREEGITSCLFTDEKTAIIDHRPVDKSFLQDFPKEAKALQSAYDLVIDADEYVAKQAADVLILKPRDQYRYTRKLWLAKDTHLPLKIEVQDFTGGTLEQVMFTDLDVSNNIPPQTLNLDSAKVQHIHQFEDFSVDKFPLVLNNIPAGFEKVFFHRTNLHSDKKPVNHLLLSDGLSSVSIYQEEKPKNYHVGLQSVGAVNSMSRLVGDQLVSVIGDVPATTVKFVAQGVMPSE